ncbi:MAG TPA: coproporphyrinogen dehydrogenase HemZ [Firmicutes bacterium]|nr:coproporphyrinogen dehydrogenase HemZ [Bacillota bacterium]
MIDTTENNGGGKPWGILTGIRPAKIAVKALREGKSPEAVVEYFVKECGANLSKANLALEVALTEAPIIDKMYPDGVSLYIGIPFCPSRCLYCSFVTNGTERARRLMPEYTEALKKEIRYVSEIVKLNGDRIETVYIGGGTPTTLTPELLEDMLKCIYEYNDLSCVKEFTVEAGRPDTITEEKLRILKDYGVGRISINPQTMNDETLKVIGRKHSVTDIIEAFYLARRCGFDDINMDLIAGLPGEDFEMFRHSLEEVEKLSPEDTTVHTLSIKRSSILNEYRDSYRMTEGEEVSRMVDHAREYMKSLGKIPYYMYRQKNQLGNLENVAYCKKGHESLYNIYIMEELQTIISMGAGGVTKTVDRETDRIERIFNVKEAKDYIERLDEMLERKSVLIRK